MIGPTGVGKTEIARRLAKLSNAPFIKVEATKFTEVGYVGRDVESMIRDLTEVAVKIVRTDAMKRVQNKASDRAEERVLNMLLPLSENIDTDEKSSSTRQVFRKKLREGVLNDKEIETEIRDNHSEIDIMAHPGMEEMTSQLKGMFSQLNSVKLSLIHI